MLAVKRLDAGEALGGIVHGDADQLHTFRSELARELYENRDLLQARRAPGRPEIDDHHFAAQRGHLLFELRCADERNLGHRRVRPCDASLWQIELHGANLIILLPDHVHSAIARYRQRR
jgi:hypothetical protein